MYGVLFKKFLKSFSYSSNTCVSIDPRKISCLATLVSTCRLRGSCCANYEARAVCPLAEETSDPEAKPSRETLLSSSSQSRTSSSMLLLRDSLALLLFAALSNIDK